MPGQKGVIDVHYNTNNVGGFSKTVTVVSNAVNNERVVLRIKGTVKQDAAAQQPAVAPAPAPNKQVAPVQPEQPQPVQPVKK